MKQRSRRKSGIIGDDASSSETNNISFSKESETKVPNKNLEVSEIKKKTLKRVLETKVSSPPKKKISSLSYKQVKTVWKRESVG